MKARRWIPLTVLGLWVLAGLATADGDVSASVDARGDLWVIGDGLGNGVSLHANYADSYTIAGLDPSTTVNGQPSVTLAAPGTRLVLVLGAGDNEAWLDTDHGSSGAHSFTRLVVVGGAGRDRLRMVGPVPETSADLGPGDDSIWVSESTGSLRGTLLLGEGDDAIEVDEFSGFQGFADLGPGSDRLQVAQGSYLAGRFVLGNGDDSLAMVESSGSFELDAGDGNDVLGLEQQETGTLTLAAGGGQDRVRLTGGDATWSRPLDPVNVLLGDGDDLLELGQVEIGVAQLDGGPGTDSYRDLGGVVFLAGPPSLRAFELPQGALGPALDIPTRIAGRVVLEDGEPVPGANVLLPQLDLLTATDAGGRFAFDAVVDQRKTLELTIGATVRGRARSGATRVELQPHATSEAGDVVLERELRNVLVFGTDPPWELGDRKAILEGNLLLLGLRPEQVTRLDELPRDLSPYGVAWHLASAASADVRQRLVDFVRAGRGLYLSGGSSLENDFVKAIANALVAGGGIEVGVTGSTGGHEFNPNAAGGVTTVPNVLRYFERSAFARFITGAAPRNVLVSIVPSGDVAGAVWDSSDLIGGRGRLVLLANAVWIQPGESLDIIENLQAFLQREPEGSPGR